MSRSRVGLVGIVASLSVGVLLAPGCGSKKSEVPSATLPADFPTDLPIYPGATLSEVTEGPGKNLKVGWTTPDEPNKVASYYADAFTVQDWSTQRVDGHDGILVFADKSSRSATIGVGTSNGKTTIDLLAVERH